LKELAALKNLQELSLSLHEDNRRGAEGTGGTEEAAMAEPELHGGNRRGAEGAGGAEEACRIWCLAGHAMVTDAGVEELKKALPACAIRR
jgi:hypothetical protein